MIPTIEQAPDSLAQLLILPGLFTFFGALVWILGCARERQEEKAPWKWIAIGLFVLGMWFGLGYFLAVFDPFYVSSDPRVEHTRKFRYAHYLAFFMPFIGVITALVWQYLIVRAKRLRY